MYCIECGKELKHGAKFCSYCGTRIEAEETDNNTTPENTDNKKTDNEAVVIDQTAKKINELTPVSLQEGVSVLYGMEQNRYILNNMISDLSYKINELGKVFKPKQPVRNTVEYKSGGVKSGTWTGVLLGFILGTAIGGANGSLLAGMFAGVLLGAGIGAIIGLIASESKQERLNKAVDEKYEEELRKYNDECVKLEARRKKEAKQQLEMQEVQRGLVKKEEELYNQLQEYYDLMGIQPEYRNIIPIGYMNDFIRLKISTKLDGNDGLNYLVRQELRADRLQMTCEEIASGLSELVDINNAVYNELLGIDKKCDELVLAIERQSEVVKQEIHKQTEYAELNAYYSQLSYDQLSYKNTMDNIYRNH